MAKTKGGRGGGGMTGASRSVPAQRGVYVQSPKPDIYVALLGVALGAMIIGCLLLVIVLNRYGFSTKVSSLRATPSTIIALTASTGNVDEIATARL